MEVRDRYKITEIGVIPKNWEVTRLESVLKIKHGKNQKEVEEINGKYPILGTGGQLGSTNSYLYDKPSILIGRKGTIDKPIYMDTPFWTVDTLFYSEVYQNAIPKYLYYNFLMIDWYSYNEASGVPSLNASRIESIKIPFPPLSEQKAIAEVLSDTDNLIQALKKRITKKRLIKKGAMQKLLTPKENWEVKKLGEFLVYEQPTIYLVADTEYNDNYNTPVLTAGKTFILGYTNEINGVFKDFPVIIFDDFTTATKFVDFSFKAKSSAMKILKPKNETVNLRFIYEIMQQINYPLGDHKRHWIGEFQHLEIKVPNIAERTRIATVLSDMDTEIETLEKKLAKYKQLKQGLMQNLLIGKIRLV